ncbi:MAG: hypothetical protein M1825_005256 [Sarcosagium campestre]|nr:MAG: hypothetical protein M1825_005256 [Sarcosagium campestre]
MSGRSAYVRKEVGKSKNEFVAPPLSRPGTGRPGFIDTDPYGGTSYASTTNSGQRSYSSHARSAASVSSWSSHEARNRRPQVLPLTSSSIEKSNFRSFMDSKSDAIRKKLSFKSGNRKPEEHGHHAFDEHYEFESRSAPSRAMTSHGYEQPVQSYAPAVNQAPRPPRTGSSLAAHQLESGLRHTEQAAPIKCWPGNGMKAQPWAKLRKDPELWDPTGDTLVYFGSDSQGMARPSASLRVHSSLIEEADSPFLVTILREGYTYNTTFSYPASPASNSSDGGRDFQSRNGFLGNDAPSGAAHKPRLPPAINSLNPRATQPTPPLSETTSHDRSHPVLHEIYFPAPSHASKVDNLRHHLTTRNVFALLLNKPLVGLNLYQALLDLHERLQMYMAPNADNTSTLISYIVTNCLDDVRGDPASAAGLLAWSEGSVVRWHEGWREAFVHCAGMYNQLSIIPEFRDISHFTRVLLERASLEMQVRVQQAEDRLAEFDFDDMWPMQSVSPPAARYSFDQFRKFLLRFYEGVFWTWPPPSRRESTDTWLNREIVNRLQSDLGALYDYLVDRDKTWEQAESGGDRKARIVSKSKKTNFRADSDDLAMTDVLLGYDNRNKIPHIPHPFPLLPSSTPVQHHAKQSLFGNKKPKGLDTKVSERRTALAYSEATNIFLLGSDFSNNELVEAFSRFEKTDQIGEIDPYDARRGRWILLYGLLQTLATLSSDTPRLRFHDDVSYFLNPRLRGTPPWRGRGEREGDDEPPLQMTSHCWTVPQTWQDKETSLERSGLSKQRSILSLSGNYDEGAQRLLDDRKPSSPEPVASVGTASVATRTSPAAINYSTQRALQWVATGGGSVAGAPSHESLLPGLASRDRNGDRFGTIKGRSSSPTTGGTTSRERPPDWPIQTALAPRPRAMGSSDFIATRDW